MYVYNAARFARWMSSSYVPSAPGTIGRLLCAAPGQNAIRPSAMLSVQQPLQPPHSHVLGLHTTPTCYSAPNDCCEPPRRRQPCCVDIKYVCPPPPCPPPKKTRWWLWLLAATLIGMFLVANFAPDKMCQWKCEDSPLYKILAPLVILRHADEEEDEDCGGTPKEQPKGRK